MKYIIGGLSVISIYLIGVMLVEIAKGHQTNEAKSPYLIDLPEEIGAACKGDTLCVWNEGNTIMIEYYHKPKTKMQYYIDKWNKSFKTRYIVK